jgi:MoaA/NifB/PqqE/SkfB family radical SAM enzyme
MRSHHIRTNQACNQRCGPWHDHGNGEEDPLPSVDEVGAAIDAAGAAGAGEIVLAGGEPGLRADLSVLVARAAASGAHVVLETNATMINGPRARKLAAAGLAVARVRLPAWGTAADALTGDPGGFAATRLGAQALAGAGIALEIVTPVVERNLHLVPLLPAALKGTGWPVEALLLAPSLASSEKAPLDALTSAVAAVAARAREVGLAVRLLPGSWVRPCMFSAPEAVAHLFAMTRGGAEDPGHAHVEACGSCLARESCPGLPVAGLARWPDLPSRIRPVVEDRLRRRLTTVSSAAEQIARELVAHFVTRRSDGRVVPARIVRINFHCNQACHFCFVSTHLPSATEAAVTAAIVEGARRGEIIVLSGGEPTLNPRLVEYVQLAKREGAFAVEIQTNALHLATPGRARRLAEAGVDEALVSLHGSRAEISDAITHAPGTWAKTVAGLDELVRTPIDVRVNFVFCRDNLHDFPALVELVGSRWPRASVVVSFVAANSDLVPRTAALIPRYSDVMPSFFEGARWGRAHGVKVIGFDSECGIPLCLIPPEDHSTYAALPELPAGSGGEEFVKTEACQRCALASRCYGLRRGYLDLYGAEELRPFAATPHLAAP